MPTLMQKIRLAIRGWNRRHEEKQQEFLKQNVWSGGQAIPPVQSRQARLPALHIDIEGLTVAYLDDSGQFHHYLDVQTGEVIDTREVLSDVRYRRVPSHESEADERRGFLATLDDSGARARLAAAQNFRSELARDRALERAWYNFRNDRAIATIDQWLREIGVK
ncbi:MAG: hypothetical protein DMF58_02690 [Acidobacteria bacterium]|nr:MAG: hypothetical protein DMF58_02690 [Acidobacteriota bacterium]